MDQAQKLYCEPSCDSELYSRQGAAAAATHLATGTQPGALHWAPPTGPPMAHPLTLMPATRQCLATDTIAVEVTPTAGQCPAFCATVASDSG